MLTTEVGIGLYLGLGLGALPLLALLLWWWNELFYAFPQKIQCSNSNTGAKLPPGHMGFPFFGEMLTFLWYFKILRKPDEFINYKRRKYGDGVGMYRSHLFGSRCIITCFPPINKFIFQSNDFMLEWLNPDLVGSTSIASVNGQAHARIRSYVTNTINRPDALRRIAQMMQPPMVACLNSWAEKGTINTFDETKRMTFQNIGELFFSLEPGSLLETIDDLFKGLVHGLRAHPFNFPGTAHHHGLECRKKLDEIFRVELEKKKIRLQNKLTTTNDLMDGLMQMNDEEGNKLSDKEVIDNIVSLVLGGYVTTALASMWAIYFLAKFPHVLQKLRDENMAIKHNKGGDFITSEDISKMKYTKNVVEEAMRMANIALISLRRATKDVEYKGYKIPKGWKVILFLRYLHTNPENFEDPMCFNPDRWNKPANPGAYQVFGGGARICAGNMLARTQITILLHHLSVGYKWELINPNAEIVYLPHQVPADGAEVSFKKI